MREIRSQISEIGKSTAPCRLLLALCAMYFAVCLPAQAQQSRKVARIGYLSAGAISRDSAFRRALRELGWVEGKNLVIEYRTAEGNYERLHDLAAELVRLQMEVIFATSTLAARAAKEATRTVPI